MHTVERSLVEHYRGRPFVVLGVSCDADRQTMLQGQTRDNATWRSIHDATSTNMERWQIQRTPTLILIDARGTIRYRSLELPTRKSLEQQIDLLLDEVPAPDKQDAGCRAPTLPLG
jgi:hypothetical protein